MKFGISLAGIYDSPDYLKDSLNYVRKIEALGFDYVWSGDSQMLHRDAYCDLTLWSLNSKRLRLGPCVTNPYTRHPSVTATAISSIDEISNGRAVLAIGTGDSALRRIGINPRPISELEQSVIQIRNLVRGMPVEYSGQPLKMRWTKGRNIPIYVAGSGPRLLTLAGRVGDGAIVHTGSSDYGIEFALNHIGEGALAVGRDPQSLDLAFFQFTSVEESRNEAIHSAKPFVTWYFVNIPKNPIVLKEVLPESVRKKLDEYRENYYRYDEESSHHSSDWETSANASSFVPDDLVEKFALAGNPEDIVNKIKKMEAKGVKHIVFRPPYTETFDQTLDHLGTIIREFRERE